VRQAIERLTGSQTGAVPAADQSTVPTPAQKGQ
jgi:hypothetical protein